MKVPRPSGKVPPPIRGLLKALVLCGWTQREQMDGVYENSCRDCEASKQTLSCHQSSLITLHWVLGVILQEQAPLIKSGSCRQYHFSWHLGCRLPPIYQQINSSSSSPLQVLLYCNSQRGKRYAHCQKTLNHTREELPVCDLLLASGTGSPVSNMGLCSVLWVAWERPFLLLSPPCYWGCCMPVVFLLVFS